MDPHDGGLVVPHDGGLVVPHDGELVVPHDGWGEWSHMMEG